MMQQSHAQQIHNRDVSVANHSEDGDHPKMVNLYSVVKQIREDSERVPVARILYVIYLNEGVKNLKKIIIQKKIEEMQSHFEASKKKDSLAEQQHVVYQRDQGARQFTGCFIEYGSFCLHLLEGESSQINQYMNLLYQESHQEKSVFSQVRIISFSEENPQRLGDKCYFEDVQNPPSFSQASQEQEQPPQFYTDKAWEIYSNVSKALQAHSKKQPKEKSMKKIHAEFRISSEDISALLSNNYMTIDEYYAFYLEDVEINLDSEKEYPYKPSLTKVLEYSDNGTLEEVQIR